MAGDIAKFLTFKGYADVIEVGPGQGVMTEYLLDMPINLMAIEYDPDMVAILDERFGGRLNVIQADFVRIDLTDFFSGRSFAIVGNFPYNISSQIVFRAIENYQRVPELVGMFQREMAARIISPPGSKGYGVISVLTQAFYSGESLMQIKPGAFHPPPKVHSMVIRLTRKDDIAHIPYKILRRIVKAAFGQRRKKLSNALKGVVPKEMLADFNLLDERAEQVPVDVFIDMAQKLEAI